MIGFINVKDDFSERESWFPPSIVKNPAHRAGL
jgi:hypothetical protein